MLRPSSASARRSASAVALCIAAAACDSTQATTPDSGVREGGVDSAPIVLHDAGVLEAGEALAPGDVTFGTRGSLHAPAGRGSFRFGAASASVQIEDQNTASDWYLWTRPISEGGLGHGTFIGDAAGGYTRAVEDVALLTNAGLDAYRFNVDWSRVEPVRDEISEAALGHYSRQIDALRAANITPMITVFHWSSPVWMDDPRRTFECPMGPRDTDLCGFAGPGVDQVIEELAEHAGLLAERYGDRVDEWCTLNEPINYILSAYGVGNFPPGRTLILGNFRTGLGALLALIRAHVAIATAIREHDRIDADGDGNATSIGYATQAAVWVPASGNRPSTNPVDVAAAHRLNWLFNYFVTEALVHGRVDLNADGIPEETHDDWRGFLDWVGVQYYFRAGVTGSPGIIPEVVATPCFGGYDLGACLPIEDSTKEVPTMDYEYWEPGIYELLRSYAARYPALPVVVTESGIATENGARRREHIVRTLEQIARARRDGADVRGYYHWSLFDNYEWHLGFAPRFGLFRVDYTTMARSPTDGVAAMREIGTMRVLSQALRSANGGLGPMTPE